METTHTKKGPKVRAKLSHKFFAAILVYSLLIVALMVGTVQFFAYRNFSEYVTRVELDKLDGLVRSLATLYQRDGGWQALRDRGDAFKQALRQSFPDERPEPAGPPAQQHRLPGPRPNPPEPQDRRPRPDRVTPSEISRRVSLFDENRRLVFGNPDLSGQALQAIELDGRAIGWLGLKRRENLIHPLDRDFLAQQVKVFYFTGAAILCLGILLAVFLSGLMVRPIRRLITAAGQLASLKFETRIEANRKDELGQLAETFNAMAETLKSYEAARRQWLSDIAHELRTPLSVLQVEIESMQDGVKTVDEKALESLRAEVLHLGRIVSDLHALSLADSGNLKLRKARIHSVAVLRETLAKYSEMLKREGLALTDEVGPAEGDVVMADRDRLIQLFTNLIENALRYADKPGELRIGRSGQGGELLLYFEDSGPGVPQEALGRLFERFYRVDRSRSRDRGGSGLGLAICKSIVETHGGGIRALRADGGGLRVEIRLPLA